MTHEGIQVIRNNETFSYLFIYLKEIQSTDLNPTNNKQK